jgi:xylose isomerase
MILVIYLISACNPSTIKLDWACFNGANKLDCNYSLFTGRETEEILLDTDEILEIEYEGDVESGTLILQIQDPEGQIIWKTKNTDQFIGARTIPIYKIET